MSDVVAAQDAEAYVIDANSKTNAQRPDPAAAAIVTAALVHVPFDGWSDAALKAGAADAGFSGDDVARLFPDGPLGAITLHS